MKVKPPMCEFRGQFFSAPCDESGGRSCETQDETTNWQTYRNEEYGFEFRYPNNWSICDLTKGLVCEDANNVLDVQYYSKEVQAIPAPTFCNANPENTRCEKVKVLNEETIVDWDWGVFISLPNGGIVFLRPNNMTDKEQFKIDFRKILSTFKFTK